MRKATHLASAGNAYVIYSRELPLVVSFFSAGSNINMQSSRDRVKVNHERKPSAEELARAAVLSCDSLALGDAIASKAERLIVLDHPTCNWETGVSRTAGTLHAMALKALFQACNSPKVKVLGQGVQGAIANCRRLMDLEGPIFLAAPGTGLEDDYTFAATKFVSMVWPDRHAKDIECLFREYVRTGAIKLDEPLGDEPRLVSHLLPLDAAIRIGNAPAAAAIVRAGARIEGVATDEMGRGMDLLEYASSKAKFYSHQVVASLRAALMERALCSAPLPPSPERHIAPVRRRAGV